VIDVTTRSGQGVTPPHGSVFAEYGSFGSVNGGFNLAYGGQKWGNFIALNGSNSGRFLDPPEFVVMHDKGNLENVFDRVDYQFNDADSVHFNLNYSRSWFQTRIPTMLNLLPPGKVWWSTMAALARTMKSSGRPINGPRLGPSVQLPPGTM